MLEASRGSPLEGALEGITNILAVGDHMQAGLQALDSLEQGGDLSSLSRLCRSRHRPMGRYSIICGYAPTCTGSALCGAASSVCRDDCDVVRDQILRVPPDEGLHLEASGSRIVIIRDIACVPQTTWGVGQQGWAPWQMWAVIDKMGPVCMGGTAHRTVVMFTPTKVSQLRCVDSAAQQDVSKSSEGCIRAWCAWPEACFRIAPTIKSLEKCVSFGGTLPKDSLDAAEGGSQKAVLIEHLIRPPLYDPLGGCVSDNVVMSEEVAK